MKSRSRFAVVLVLLVVVCVALAVLVKIMIQAKAPKWTRQDQAHIDMRSVQYAFDTYMAEYNSAPTGNPAQVVSLLISNNLFRAALLEVCSLKLISSGELVDPWHTPYRIVISGTNIEMRSAGPDTLIGTKDDLCWPR